MFYICGPQWRKRFSETSSPSKLFQRLRGFEFSDNPKKATVVFVNVLDESLREFWKIADRDQVRVFVGSEAIFPDLNTFDFSMGFDFLEAEGRHLRLHPSYLFEDVFPQGWVNNAAEITPEVPLSERGFCDFIYSNPDAHPMRDQLFFAVNSLKEVSVYGRYNPLTRTLAPRSPSPRRGVQPVDLMREKVSIQKHHRFSIVAENADYSGYTSEKTLSSLLAGQIPIYWGNRRIEEDYNSERFLDSSKFNSIDSLLDHLKLIERDESRLLELASKPWYTNWQLDEVHNSERKLDEFLNKVFSAASSKSLRRGIGSFPKIAEARARRSSPSWISEWVGKARNYLKRIIQRLAPSLQVIPRK